MALRYALLGALADQPRTGYALLKHFEQSLAYAWPASHSQIYPELARLLEDGLIEQTGTGRAQLEDVRGHRGRARRGPALAARDGSRPPRPQRRGAAHVLPLAPRAREAARSSRASAHTGRACSTSSVRIRAEPTGHNKKARTLRIALEGGIRMVEARLAWLDDALAEVRSEEWRGWLPD